MILALFPTASLEALISTEAIRNAFCDPTSSKHLTTANFQSIITALCLSTHFQHRHFFFEALGVLGWKIVPNSSLSLIVRRARANYLVTATHRLMICNGTHPRDSLCWKISPATASSSHASTSGPLASFLRTEVEPPDPNKASEICGAFH